MLVFNAAKNHIWNVLKLPCQASLPNSFLLLCTVVQMLTDYIMSAAWRGWMNILW